MSIFDFYFLHSFCLCFAISAIYKISVSSMAFQIISPVTG